MREILFRGKRVDDGEWVVGSFAVASGRINHGKSYILATTSDFSYGDNGSRIRIGCWSEVDPDTVGQWTGLTDRHGVQVFEEDIVVSDEMQAVVKFGRCGGVKNTEHEVGYMGFYLDSLDEKCKRYGLRDDIVYWHEEYGLEVIGNIHDNPELLKGERA